MADPAAAWPPDTETDRLRRALAEAEAELQRHGAALAKLQGELMASRLEVSGAREETVQLRGMLRRAEANLRKAEASASADQARIASLEADAIGRNAEIMGLQAEIGRLQAETRALRTGMDVLHASLSWRISAPVRLAGRVMRRILRPAIRRAAVSLRAASPPPSPSAPPPAAPLPAPADLPPRAILQADPRPAATEGVVTLDALYQLSRSL
jgi:hypothetical protein